MRQTGERERLYVTHSLMRIIGGEFQEKLADELELLSAEASIRGMEQEDFMELCRKAFQRMEVVYL